MLTLYPPLYDDELLYSGHARYAERINDNRLSVCANLFQKKSFILLPGADRYICAFVKQLPSSNVYDETYLIDHHTLLPLFKLTLKQENIFLVRETMISNNIDSRLSLLGRLNLNFLCLLGFCPICAQEDIDNYGEPYWHRIHQIKGLDICVRHKVWLERQDFDQFQFLSAWQAKIQNRTPRPISKYDDDYFDLQTRFARNAQLILNNHNLNLTMEGVKKRSSNLLLSKGLYTPAGEVLSKKLIMEYENYYSKSIIDKIQGNLNNQFPTLLSRYFWKTEKGPTWVVPLTIPFLVIDFLGLGLDLEKFISVSDKVKPFGEGPWKCLNPVCELYLQDSIKECNLTHSRSYFIGEFACECGFTYRLRRLANSEILDPHHSIVSYGNKWMNEAQHLLGNNSLSVDYIHQRLGISRRKVKILRKEGGKIKLDILPQNIELEMKIKAWREEWIVLQNPHPQASRSELYKLNQRLYTDLSVNDRIWLEEHLPPLYFKGKPGLVSDPRYWEKKDLELLPKIREAYSNLLQDSGSPKRITIHLIQDSIGKSLTHINKLPNCRKLLSEICEDRCSFLKRLVNYYINLYTEQAVIPSRANYYNHFLHYMKDRDLKVVIDDGYQRIRDAGENFD